MPVTGADIEELWVSMVGVDYAKPLLANADNAAVLRALFAMYARMVQAMDTTTGALYRTGWPSQYAPPASGDAKALVSITLTRDSAAFPLYFARGAYPISEQVFDAPEFDSGDKVSTGRRYHPQSVYALAPSELSATFIFEAEKPGYGYNNPGPGSLTRLPDDFVASGVDATLAPYGTYYALTAALTDRPMAPDYVGQTVRITSSPYTDEFALVIGFQPATTTHNGQLILWQPYIFTGLTLSGTPVAGEEVQQGNNTGVLATLYGDYAVVFATKGTFVTTTPIVCQSSGAIFQGSAVKAPAFTGTTTGVDWELVTPQTTHGLTATNADFPSGGALGMLDSIGLERGMPRGLGESDTQYAERIGVPETVSPLGIQRTIAQVLTPLGKTATLREPPGAPLLPGFYVDWDALDYPDTEPYAYRFLFDEARARAFFVVELPRMNDNLLAGVYNHEGAYGSGGIEPFIYDGYSIDAARRRQLLYQRVQAAKAAGVAFEFVEEWEDLDIPLWKFRGCLLNVRSDAGVTVDGSNNVTEWADQSPNENHLIPGASPLKIASDAMAGGKPSIEFDGTEWLVSTWPMPLNTYTVITVMKGATGYMWTHGAKSSFAAANASYLWGSTGATIRSYRTPSGNDHRWDYTTSWGLLYKDVFSTYVVRDVGTTVSFFNLLINGRQPVLTNPTDTGTLGTTEYTGYFGLCADPGGGSPASITRVVEVAVYNRALSNEELRQIDKILQRRYKHWDDPVRDPTQVAGLTLWLDASDLSTLEFLSTGEVTRWKNKVAGKTGDFTQPNPSATYRPQYTASDPAYAGKAVLTSATTTRFLVGSFLADLLADPGYTVFVVGDRNASTAYLLAGETGARFQLSNSGTAWEVYAGVGSISTSGAYASTPNVICGEVGPTTSDRIFAANMVTPKATGNAGNAALAAAPLTNLGIFGLADGSLSGSGKIAEVLIYRRILADWERRAVGRYLGQKYGLPVY